MAGRKQWMLLADCAEVYIETPVKPWACCQCPSHVGVYFGASKGPCKGYVIDHIEPLACGGAGRAEEA
jgi:hypothetical protein